MKVSAINPTYYARRNSKTTNNKTVANNVSFKDNYINAMLAYKDTVRAVKKYNFTPNKTYEWNYITSNNLFTNLMNVSNRLAQFSEFKNTDAFKLIYDQYLKKTSIFKKDPFTFFEELSTTRPGRDLLAAAKYEYDGIMPIVHTVKISDANRTNWRGVCLVNLGSYDTGFFQSSDHEQVGLMFDDILFDEYEKWDRYYTMFSFSNPKGLAITTPEKRVVLHPNYNYMGYQNSFAGNSPFIDELYDENGNKHKTSMWQKFLNL